MDELNLSVATKDKPGPVNFQQEANAFITERNEEYQMQSLQFIDMLGEVDQEKKKELLTALVEEKLELREVAKAFQITQEEFIDRMSKLNPCPVYIHPNTELLKVGNLVANKEFIK